MNHPNSRTNPKTERENEEWLFPGYILSRKKKKNQRGWIVYVVCFFGVRRKCKCVCACLLKFAKETQNELKTNNTDSAGQHTWQETDGSKASLNIPWYKFDFKITCSFYSLKISFKKKTLENIIMLIHFRILTNLILHNHNWQTCGKTDQERKRHKWTISRFKDEKTDGNYRYGRY